jgi:uncharacterized membrane protein YgdD (TMEM256/DUF423 family)
MNALLTGAILGALGVVVGAFGAHALKATLAPEKLAIFEVGVRYHLIHALALLAVGLAQRSDGGGGGALRAAGPLLAGGVLLFSGSLYGLALGGPAWLGPVTPLGGALLIAGWIALALGVRGG